MRLFSHRCYIKKNVQLASLMHNIYTWQKQLKKLGRKTNYFIFNLLLSIRLTFATEFMSKQNVVIENREPIKSTS